jgi:DNA-binding CsgD family transcriptional regulator
MFTGENLVDRIYECAFVPEGWPKVLDSLARIAAARGGVLFAANASVMNCTMSDGIADVVQKFLDGNYFALSQRAGRAFAAALPGFIREQDLFADEELDSDPLYRDVLHPAGLNWRAADRIYLTDRSANALLRSAIRGLDEVDAIKPRSFAVQGPHGLSPVVAHLLPVRRTARDIFGAAMGVLILTPLGSARAPSAALVQSLFDLTPTEARVARSLTAGASVSQIAGDAGVSLATIRSQVRGVLEKTGCTRQAELVALLGGALAPGENE